MSDAVIRVTLLAMLLPGCVVFEAPEDAGQRLDAGVIAAVDAGPNRDAAAAPDGGTDAGDDAGVDAGVDAGRGDSGILRRPPLAPCGYGAPFATGHVVDPGLDEVSGLAASRRHPGVFWVVEDSGSAPVVYAINGEGRTLGTYRVAGTAIDYEDVSIGPGPEAGVDFLYVADIGDNDGTRATITIYRAPEPDVVWDQAAVTGSLEQVEPLPMTFPAGLHDNAEAFFVDPATQDLYVITKNGFSRPNTLFLLAAPHTPAVARELVALGGLYAGSGIDISITSAAISADGRRLVTRGLRAINAWTRTPGVSIADTLLMGTPCDAPIADEEKGESITLTADGYVTTSEGVAQALSFAPFAP